MAAISSHGLPLAPSGIAAGRFVVRDGDVYGHTVDLAARIAAHAGAGELLVSAAAAESLTDSGSIAEDAGQVMLKGIPEPAGVIRIRP